MSYRIRSLAGVTLTLLSISIVLSGEDALGDMGRSLEEIEKK